MSSEQDEKISQVASITGASPAESRTILESVKWDIQEAIQLYYESQEPAGSASDMDQDDNNQRQPSRQPARPPTSSSSGWRGPPQQNRLRTIRDIQGDAAADDSDDDDEKQDFFAGGEKSGLAVQNPNNQPDHFNSIINQARQNRARPDDDEEPARPSNFTGRAQTLGGDDAPSQVIEDPTASSRRTNMARVTRTLHLWQDGFSVDDGPLFRFDDPQNAAILALINQGRAPLQLLGVEPGQEVDLQLNPHKDEKYVQPKAKYKAFGGAGQRLGSPTPGPSSSSAPPQPQSQTTTSAPQQTAASTPSVSVDDSQPVVTLQVRLGDGTRLQSRFNTSHTIGDVYEFVNTASPQSSSRSYVLMTTFPSKELSDKGAKLGDMAEFKRGGAVVQKWT